MSKKVDWGNLLKSAGIGGLVIGLSAYIATYMSTKMAAIVWSLPLTLFPAMFYMWVTKSPNSRIADYGFNSGFGCINLITFCCIVGYVLKFTKFKDNKKYGALYAIGIACIFWTIGAVILYFISPYGD
jgi:hypothetical protein